MLPLVQAAQTTWRSLQEGYKYCLVIPGILGGKYDSSNIATAPLLEIVGLSGELGHQLSKQSDGEKVKITIVE